MELRSRAEQTITYIETSTIVPENPYKMGNPLNAQALLLIQRCTYPSSQSADCRITCRSVRNTHLERAGGVLVDSSTVPGSWWAHVCLLLCSRMQASPRTCSPREVLCPVWSDVASASPQGGAVGPRRVLFDRGRIISTTDDASKGAVHHVELSTGTHVAAREEEVLDWGAYPARVAVIGLSPTSPETIAIWRCEMFGEGLFSCLFWAVGFLDFESRSGILTRLGEEPARMLIDWSDPRLLFHGTQDGGSGTGSCNAWDCFFLQPPPPHATLGGTHGECEFASVTASDIEHAAAVGKLGITTAWGPPYFCKLGNFRGGEPSGFVSDLHADVDVGGDELYAPPSSRFPDAVQRLTQLDERDWGGPLDEVTIAEGRAACSRWVVVREALRHRAESAFASLCAVHLPPSQWLAVHVRQTDRLSYGSDCWVFDVRTLAEQVLERAAALRCRGVFVASDNAAMKVSLAERLRHAGLLVAMMDVVLSATPGVAAHKDPLVDRRRNATDCLIEVLMMARCAGIVCTLSNVSVAACFFAPQGFRHFLFQSRSEIRRCEHPSGPLVLAQVKIIQAECFADDVPFDYARMAHWDEAEVRSYFETGGDETPAWDHACACESRLGNELRRALLAGHSSELVVPESSTFVKLRSEGTSLRLASDSLFETHKAFHVPCEPSVKGTSGQPPPIDVIHRFELQKHFAPLEGLDGLAALNASLQSWALEKERRAALCAEGTPPGLNSDAGMRVSNRGGYQSYHDLFLWQGSSAGCRVLQTIVSAAMDILRSMSCANFVSADSCRDEDEPPWDEVLWRPGSLYMIDAWVNVNRPEHHNVLHTHHAERWSAVYFVCQGEPREQDDDCSGQLILRGGPAKMRRSGGKVEWSSHTFLAVPPVPGTLWLFPGGIPHAVVTMCRIPPEVDLDEESPPCTRISVAMNFQDAKSPVPRLLSS